MAAIDVPLGRVADVVRDACAAMGWTQRELSRRSGVPQSAISRFLRGRLDALDLAQILDLGSAFGGRMHLVFDAPFLADRARQRDAVHARCVGYVARLLRASGWLVATEVEIRGSRGPGWIDVLAYHPGSHRLLVIEIKTELDDFGRIQRTLGWYAHEARAAARTLGWQPRVLTPALLLLATKAVDARLRQNRDLARIAFPQGASALRRLVADPVRSGSLPAIATIDPLSRASAWLRPTVLDGRSAPSPHLDYADVARRLHR